VEGGREGGSEWREGGREGGEGGRKEVSLYKLNFRPLQNT